VESTEKLSEEKQVFAMLHGQVMAEHPELRPTESFPYDGAYKQRAFQMMHEFRYRLARELTRHLGSKDAYPDRLLRDVLMAIVAAMKPRDGRTEDGKFDAVARGHEIYVESVKLALVNGSYPEQVIEWFDLVDEKGRGGHNWFADLEERFLDMKDEAVRFARVMLEEMSREGVEPELARINSEIKMGIEGPEPFEGRPDHLEKNPIAVDGNPSSAVDGFDVLNCM